MRTAGFWIACCRWPWLLFVAVGYASGADSPSDRFAFVITRGEYASGTDGAPDSAPEVLSLAKEFREVSVSDGRLWARTSSASSAIIDREDCIIDRSAGEVWQYDPKDIDSYRLLSWEEFVDARRREAAGTFEQVEKEMRQVTESWRSGPGAFFEGDGRHEVTGREGTIGPYRCREVMIAAQPGVRWDAWVADAIQLEPGRMENIFLLETGIDPDRGRRIADALPGFPVELRMIAMPWEGTYLMVSVEMIRYARERVREERFAVPRVVRDRWRRIEEAASSAAAIIRYIERPDSAPEGLTLGGLFHRLGRVGKRDDLDAIRFRARTEPDPDLRAAWLGAAMSIAPEATRDELLRSVRSDELALAESAAEVLADRSPPDGVIAFMTLLERRDALYGAEVTEEGAAFEEWVVANLKRLVGLEFGYRPPPDPEGPNALGEWTRWWEGARVRYEG